MSAGMDLSSSLSFGVRAAFTLGFSGSVASLLPASFLSSFPSQAALLFALLLAGLCSGVLLNF